MDGGHGEMDEAGRVTPEIVRAQRRAQKKATANGGRRLKGA